MLLLEVLPAVQHHWRCHQPGKAAAIFQAPEGGLSYTTQDLFRSLDMRRSESTQAPLLLQYSWRLVRFDMRA